MHGTTAGNPVPLTTFAGLVAIADPVSLPEGTSPRTYDTDFKVGEVGTRPGLTNTYHYANSAIGPFSPSVASSTTWANPSSILLHDGTYTSASLGDLSAFLDTTAYGINVPLTASVTGVSVSVSGHANTSGTLFALLLINGVAVGDFRQAALTSSDSVMTFGGLGDSWHTGLTVANVNNSSFGIRLFASSTFTAGTVFLDNITLQVGIATGGSNFNFITTFADQDGSVKNLALDAAGDFFVEDVTNNPGVLTLALSGITPGSYAKGVNGQGVEFLAFSNGATGSDIPRQYTKDWIDRISQVGPGAAPQFVPKRSNSNTFPITNIAQPAAQSFGSSYFLQSTGVGVQTEGNVVTVYYQDSTVGAADADLTTAFNSGNSTFVFFNFSGSGITTQGPYTVLVTSVGLGKPPGQPRQFYYFTYNLPTAAAVYFQGSGHPTFTAAYQRTLATITTTNPVPQLSVGQQAVVTGNSVTAWNSTWAITQTINSGTMAITQSSLDASGTGTYSYAVTSGANPVAGQLVTITGTLNADGVLNVVNVPIATVTGTSNGTFTITNLSAGTAFTALAEEGQAVTAGTLFAFDPGIAVVGSATSPIFGTGTGGNITITGSGQLMSTGTRRGVVFFITRNGYFTAPSPYVTFTTPANTTGIFVTNIPIGPPNVIARAIAFTEAGQNGVPGANYFFLPADVQYTVNNQSFTATKTQVLDNVTTSATFFFTDTVLLNALAIDVQGQNLFNLIEIGDPGWIVQYDSRNFYGLCRNKVNNFLNLSFDGGYLPSQGALAPLGWSNFGNGTLRISPIFGNSYYIQNTGNSTPVRLGQLSQSAYQDIYNQPIIQTNTLYSCRISARNPSGTTSGNLVVSLEAGGVIYGSVVIFLGLMTSSFQTFDLPMLITKLATIPSNLTLNVFAANFAPGADVEIDRLDLYPTEIPVLSTIVYGSYANDFESVDAVTGKVDFISENQQPVNGAVVMYDTFYALKDSSMYSLRSSPNLEPAQWDEPEVAQKAGACGINAYDFGEQWIVEASRNGIYLYEGGLPGKIMQEIYPIWESLNWTAKSTIWVRNDVTNRRLFVGVPLPTPNFWLPDAPVNANPTSPNVILMCNYLGVETGEGIKQESGIHVTMFGTVEAGDMRRKWSIWQIPSPYASFVTTSTDMGFAICNGVGNSKIYELDLLATTDDGQPINALYTTYGFVNLSKVSQYPLLGFFRKLWGYLTMTVANSSTLNVRLLPETLLGPSDSTSGYYPWTVPGGFSPMPIALRDRECPLNFAATRTFVEVSGQNWTLKNLTMHGKKHPQNALTGQK